MSRDTDHGIETISKQACFGGAVGYYRHQAASTACAMRFSVFTPPQAEKGPVPVLWWLSGLTCTEDNFTVKAGAFAKAAELGLMIVAPDTSPRGEGVPNDDAYDFGQGAGFYVDATQQPWARNFNMYSYITRELQALVLKAFPADAARQGILGHSMGGHGALTIGLRHPEIYKSISAFSPICAPTQCPWGLKAFAGYLGPDQSLWAQHDATELMKRAGNRTAFPPILIDQGDKDNFLEEQLKPHLFEEACKGVGQVLDLRLQPGYDHSYFFIASFIDDHLKHHAGVLSGLC